MAQKSALENAALDNGYNVAGLGPDGLVRPGGRVKVVLPPPAAVAAGWSAAASRTYYATADALFTGTAAEAAAWMRERPRTGSPALAEAERRADERGDSGINRDVDDLDGETALIEAMEREEAEYDG